MIGPTMRSAILWIGLLVVVGLVGGPTVSLLSGPSWASAPVGSHAPSASPGASHVVAAARPSVTPNCADGTNDAYNALPGNRSIPIFPFWPYGGDQTPCVLTGLDPNIGGVFNDEVHATLSSNAVSSGDRWEIPIRLPFTTSTYLSEPDTGAYIDDFYVGMVVTGDSNSVGGLSYLSVIFSPVAGSGGALAFDVTLSVLSLYETNCTSPVVGLQLTFNGYYACEGELLGPGTGIALPGSLPAGDRIMVTFDGAVGAGAPPLIVYLNDSTNYQYNTSYRFLKSASTDGLTFLPAYSSSCVDLCYLNWSMPFGNGIGVDLNVNTLDYQYQALADPIAFGAAHYYVSGSGYTGDFKYFAPESASGGCQSGTATLVCTAILNSTSSYPFFQFNGSAFDFGSSTDYNWTTEDFNTAVGGANNAANVQFASSGAATDLVPAWLGPVTNSSTAGFVPPDTSITVNARAQDWGSISSVQLNYSLPGQTTTTLATMSRNSGNASNGIYSASIPASSTNGVVFYNVLASTHGGASFRFPSGADLAVREEPIPTFHITFTTSVTSSKGGITPPNKGCIGFQGFCYSNNQGTSASAGVYRVEANCSYPDVFTRWVAVSGLSLNLTGQPSKFMELNLTGNGTLEIVCHYVQPFDRVTVEIASHNCGSLILNGTTYVANTTVKLLDSESYALTYSACALNGFAGWQVTDAGTIGGVPVNLTVLGKPPKFTLSLHGNGTIVLNYLPTSDPNAAALVLDSSPSSCGGTDSNGLLLNGAGYTNGSSIQILTETSYPIAPDPCSNWGTVNITATSSITLSGGSLVAAGPGIVTANYYRETIISFLTYPEGCGYILFNNVAYYSGQSVAVNNNSQATIFGFPCAGYSFTGAFSCSGGVFCAGNVAVIQGSGTIEMGSIPGQQTEFVEFVTFGGACNTGTDQIVFNGAPYNGSQYTRVPPGTRATILASACPGYGFVSWATGGPGITIGNARLNPTYAIINGSGSIIANFQPLEPIQVQTSPSDCGSAVIAGVAYSNGQTAEVPEFDNVSISATPCAHYQLAAFEPSSGAVVGNGTIYASSPTILLVRFTLVVYDVVVDVSPGNCGGTELKISGSLLEYNNNTTLGVAFGQYAITAAPCPGFNLVEWRTTGQLSVANTTSAHTILTVDGNGVITGVYLPLPPTVTIAFPGSADAGATVSFTANVPNPVNSFPHHTYSYTWTFGDATSAVTPTGFTTHAYTLPGTYRVTVTVKDPYDRTVSSSGTILVETASGSGVVGLGSIGVPGFAAIGAAAAVIVVAVVLGMRGPRRQ